jgi:glycosyltransferase involved in cell wall biosynthesis
MKIVFFGNASEKIAAIRYRVIWFAEMLEAEGHTCVICLPASLPLREKLYEDGNKFQKLLYHGIVWWTRLFQIRHVFGADVVFFRGPLFDYGPPFFERIIRMINPRLVFDIDDAIWEPPAYVTSWFKGLIDYGWVRKMARMSRHAVVGNAYLADYVRPLNPNITIVPTCIDMDRHAPKDYDDDPARPVRLGWTGLKDNLGYLKMIEPVLQDLARDHNIEIVISTGRDYALEGVTVRNFRWRLDEEIFYLQHADIGLMPLVDSPRARGKCAFKALQYMGVGTPCVISPVGMNAEVIDEGVTGYLADSPDEWKEKLRTLIVDADLRQRMGRAARQVVIDRYSHAANYPAFKAALEVASQR